MSDAKITRIRFRTTPFAPASGQLDGTKYVDMFRVLFDVTIPKDADCNEYKIHVEIWEVDDLSPNDLVAGSPFPIDRCYKMEPGNYTFYIGSVDPFGNAFPKGTEEAAKQAKNELTPGSYTLPGWSPISFNGDAGSEYEYRAIATLIPCCEEAEPVQFSSFDQDVKITGGPDALETLINALKELGGIAGAVASAAKGFK